LPPDATQHPVIDSDHQLPASGPPSRDKKTGMRVLIWILLLVFFAAGFYLVIRHRDAPRTAGAGGGGRRGAGAGGPVPVTTETARSGDIGVYIDAIGTVTPVYTSNITAQVTGIVTEVHYREGQLVSKGTPLLEIDSRPYRATLAQAQGILQRDKGVLAQAQMNLERYQAAWARNAIPRQQLDDQEKVLEQVKGTVANDEGVVQADEIQVQFCHIVSPITGRIGLRLVDPGNVVQANSGTLLAVVTQLQPITVVFTVAEDALTQVQPRLRKGAKLPVEVYERTNQNLIAKGTLISLDNQVDTTTGTVKARASFSNSDSVLFPNSFVNVRLLVDTVHNATLISSDAIQHNGQDTFVYVVRDGHAHVRPVTSRVTEGQTTQVEGISPGDVLVTTGFDKLQDNAQVTNAPRRGGAAGGSRRGGGATRGQSPDGASGARGPRQGGGQAGQDGSAGPRQSNGAGQSEGNLPSGSGPGTGNASGGGNRRQPAGNPSSGNPGNGPNRGSAPR
jgi:multidrug efflux system membrane fusion protein